MYLRCCYTVFALYVAAKLQEEQPAKQPGWQRYVRQEYTIAY